MASKYQIWNPLYNYRGAYSLGNSKKQQDLSNDRFDQSFFPIEDIYSRIANDFATQYPTTMGLQSRIKRDMAQDAQNPREKLPEDLVSAMMIDAVPMFAWSHPPDLSTPEDFKANDQISLIQSAFLNCAKQEELFTNPQFFFDPSLNTDKKGKGVQPMKQVDFYSFDGSAAGMETNRLGGEASDESYRVNSIESHVAF